MAVCAGFAVDGCAACGETYGSIITEMDFLSILK